jgi:hypothetical protein
VRSQPQLSRPRVAGPSSVKAPQVRVPDPPRVLDFDTENVPGFYWYDGVTTDLLDTIAWSWMDEDDVEVETLTNFRQADTALTFPASGYERFKSVVATADIVTGHNILRHDIPLLNATGLRLGLPQIAWPRTVDTLQLLRNMGLKGFPKGQEYLADHFQIGERKMHVGLHTWEKAARGDPEARKVVIERCVSDVISHKELYKELMQIGG